MKPSEDAIKRDARQAIEECLGVVAGESVSVIYDDPREDEARVLAKATQEVGASAVLINYGDQVAELVADPLTYAPPPPAPLKQAMINSDAVLLVTDVEWPIHLFYAVYEATALAQRKRTRIAFPEKELGTWNISKEEMEKISKRVWNASQLLDGATEVHITSPGGTDMRVSIEGRKPIHNTPIMRPGEILSFVPYYGELALAPIESAGDGRIVFDGSLLGTGVGPHEESATAEARRVRAGVRTQSPEEPVTLEVRAGRCVKVTGGKEADVIRKLFAEVPDADRIGEFAFGTSERSDPDTTASLGTAHFAFGDNIMYGGRTASAMHQNGVVLNASIQILDNEAWILKEGQWQLPE